MNTYKTEMCKHELGESCIWCAGGEPKGTVKEQLAASVEAMAGEFEQSGSDDCESCGNTGRIQIAPDSDVYHPCDSCLPHECRMWMAGYHAKNIHESFIDKPDYMQSLIFLANFFDPKITNQDRVAEHYQAIKDALPTADEVAAIKEVIRISDRNLLPWDKTKAYLARLEKHHE